MGDSGDLIDSPIDEKRTRILVTGGAGFLGCHLVRKLLGQGHHVIVMDNHWTSTSSGVEEFKHHPSFELVQADVTHPFPPSIAASKIYHLASPASPKYFDKSPIGILDTCYIGTRNALEAARDWNARILFASTSEVYGDPQRWPQAESYRGNTNSFGPRSCYDEGKRVAEALMYGFKREHAVDVRIARIFNVYGPGMAASDGRAVSSFIDAALKGRDLVVNGDGTASRCFQYVDDCVDGLEKLMESPWEGGPINLGAETETSIRAIAEQIAESVARLTGKPRSDIVHVAAMPDDPQRRLPDCTLAKEVLGWEARTGLEEGLTRTVEWHMSSQGS